MEYRCKAMSVAGFIQQVAVAYLARGYWFYVAGRIPERKDPHEVDRKLIEKYRIDTPRWERVRRKKAGLANMQYIRHEQFFLLMATHGQHRFFVDEAGQIRDARRAPIKYAGYSISFRNGRACVRIERSEYFRLKAHLLDVARYTSTESMIDSFQNIRFASFRPIRGQILAIWRSANRVRRQAGYERVPIECVRWKRPIVRPFGDGASRFVEAA